MHVVVVTAQPTLDEGREIGFRRHGWLSPLQLKETISGKARLERQEGGRLTSFERLGIVKAMRPKGP
jgi:hypothetical protein